MIDIRDIGDAALKVFLNWEEWKGKFVPLAGDHLTPKGTYFLVVHVQPFNLLYPELVDIFQEATGRTAKYVPIALETYAKQQFPGAEEMAQMFGWFVDFGYFGSKHPDLQLGKKLNPNLKTWKEWIVSTGFGKQESSG
jgi:hypothetical protein